MRGTSLYGVTEEGFLEEVASQDCSLETCPEDTWQRLAACWFLSPLSGVMRAFSSQSPTPAHICLPAGDTGPKHLMQSKWHGLHQLRRKGAAPYSLQLMCASPWSHKQRISRDNNSHWEDVKTEAGRGDGCSLNQQGIITELG